EEWRLVNAKLPRGAMGTLAEGLRTRCGLDTSRRRRVIAVRMSDEDVRYGLTPHGIEQRLDVRFLERARIDHGNTIPTNNVADGSLEGERSRIVAQQPAHTRIDLLDLAGWEIEAPVERDVVIHQAAGRPPTLAASRAMWPSLRLRTGKLHYLGPLLGFFSDDLAKLFRGSIHQHPTHIGKTRADIRVSNCRVDLLVELVDDLGRRSLGSTDPEPGARLVPRHEISDDRNVRQCIGTLCRGHRQRSQAS